MEKQPCKLLSGDISSFQSLNQRREYINKVNDPNSNTNAEHIGGNQLLVYVQTPYKTTINNIFFLKKLKEDYKIFSQPKKNNSYKKFFKKT